MTAELDDASATGARTSNLRSVLGKIEGREAILIILAWKLGVFAVLFLAAGLLQPESRVGQEPKSFSQAYHLMTTGLATSWDANHYIYLAEEGYAKDQFQNAFFPLYPLSIRLLNLLTGDSLLSALLVSNLASFGGLYLFYLFVKRLYTPQAAMIALVLFISFPTAFYLNVVYSEGLFLGLTMLFLSLLYRRRYPAAAVVAFLLPLVRSIGFLAVAPFAVFVLTDALRRAGETKTPLSRNGLKVMFEADWLYALAPLAGFLAYLGYMYLATGDPYSGFEAQDKFASQVRISRIFEPGFFLKTLFTSHLNVHSYANSALDRVVFVGFVVSLPFVYRHVDKALFLFCVLLGLIPLLGTFAGYMRYVMICFPVYIAFGSYIANRSSAIVAAAATPMLLTQGLLATMYIMTYWVA